LTEQKCGIFLTILLAQVTALHVEINLLPHPQPKDNHSDRYQVIEYTQEDFPENSKTYEIIFDTVGKRSF